jgi:2,5-diketo-D-gluconate reductase A
MTAVPNLPLSTGSGTIDIPQLGFGVFKVPDDEAPAAVRTALEVGYRSIDTAKLYGNEKGVGRAIAESDLAREDIFVTTKVWNDEQGFDQTLAAFDTSAKKLGLDVVDLYLIHWPTPAQDTYVETFKALLRLREDGRIRAAGVCNFQPDHLARLKDETGEFPAINQIELHPRLQQPELRDFHAANGIVTEAWAPLARAGEVFEDPVVVEVAKKHGVTPAQAILRWHMELGNVAIPKSVKPARIAENFDVFGFSLDDEDLTAIAGLDRGHRTGPDPDTMNG